ncbi:MAG: cytochrome c [Fuerstiella sp.]|jgi:mono/diheme cytochrome c family protein|nr:cytochrome c [Fuerstiella sp.]
MNWNRGVLLGLIIMQAIPCSGQIRNRVDIQRYVSPAPGEVMTLTQKVETGWPVRWGEFRMHHPQGSTLKVKGPIEMTDQFDLASYRTPLESTIVSRRWHGESMYLANEQFYSSHPFWLALVDGGFPVAHSPQLEWILLREAYWYSRYMLSHVSAQSRMGIHMVHGPYWQLKAMEYYRHNRIVRDRGERTPSTKDVFLGVYAPLFSKRTGWPRVFEDANPTMLDYASGDPHLTGQLPVADTFADPMSNKVYGWGVPGYLIDWRSNRWDHDTIDTTINMGVVGQIMKKKLAWTRSFFRKTHEGPGHGEPARLVTQVGASAGDGFRGVNLLLGALNGMLEIKAALLADENGCLGGVNPSAYDPSCGLKYIPHKIKPNLIFNGDLPIRPNAYDPLDLSSQLWDQASLLWALAEYYEQCFRFQTNPDVPVAVFSVDPPVDGGLIEQRTYRVALGLSNLIIKNLQAMHFRNGALASCWTPDGGPGGTVSMRDSSMAIIALVEYDHHLKSHGRDPYPELRETARAMAMSHAEFLVSVQSPDGSFNERYCIRHGKGKGRQTLMRDQFFGIRALCSAYQMTGDKRFLQAARRTWNLLHTQYWDESTGLYRSDLQSDVAVYTPVDLAVAYAGIREMILTSPSHRAGPLLEHFVRFWVQSLNNSGMQMSEDYNTGEISFGLVRADDDEDGIPFIAASHGAHGVAPIPAGVVAINLGPRNNPRFSCIQGDRHVSCGPVAAFYKPRFDPSRLLLTEIDTDDSFVQRETLNRWEAMPLRLAPSRQNRIGSDLTGREIFRNNCVVCHGQRGEGIFGASLKYAMSEYSRKAVISTITKGRMAKSMPAWGHGVDDLNIVDTDAELIIGNVLTEEEIERVADYIKTDLATTYMRTLSAESYFTPIDARSEVGLPLPTPDSGAN